MQRPDHATVLTPAHIAMNGNFCLWRIVILAEHYPRFTDVIRDMADGINRQNRRSLGKRYTIDVILTEEELAFMKLSVPLESSAWLQDWIYAKL